MNRRRWTLLAFVFFAGGIIWYGSGLIKVPDISFKQAAAINDAKQKVIVTGRLEPGPISQEGEGLSFQLKDGEGGVSRISYSGEDPIDVPELEKARTNGENVSVSGHSHGDYFHASGITIH
jgi:hypothetical protein